MDGSQQTSRGPKVVDTGAPRRKFDPLTALARMPVLRRAPRETLSALARRASLLELPKGFVVFKHGDRPTGLYFVLEGSVKLTIPEPNGREKTVELFRPGRMFGEIGVFRQSPYCSWAETLWPTRLIHVPQADVLEAVRRDHSLALSMLAEVSGRVQSLLEGIATVGAYGGTQRVAAFLLEQFAARREDSPQFSLPATKSTIASLLNLSKESLSRILRQLVDAGIIRMRGRTIIVPDPARLTSLLAA